LTATDLQAFDAQRKLTKAYFSMLQQTLFRLGFYMDTGNHNGLAG